jgi:hypothetical protein
MSRLVILRSKDKPWQFKKLDQSFQLSSCGQIGAEPVNTDLIAFFSLTQ